MCDDDRCVMRRVTTLRCAGCAMGEKEEKMAGGATMLDVAQLPDNHSTELGGSILILVS